MKEEKNLDRLFQEKFKDFERHPSDAVWKNIAAAQNEDENRKIIPLWWRLGGVAAIAILLTTGIVLFNNSSTNTIENPIVTTSDTPATNTNQTTQTQLNPVVADNDNTTSLSETVTSTSDFNTISIAQNDENISSAKKESNVQNTNQTVANNSNKTTTESYNTTTPSQDKLKGVVVTQESTPRTNPIIDERKSQEILKEQIKANSGVTQATQESKETPQETANEKISLVEEAKRIEEESVAVALVEDTPNAQPVSYTHLTLPTILLV